ncbi:MAG: AMP-binding protein [Archangium sp.]|nr:AMP-binding protein [Archangium sp.]
MLAPTATRPHYAPGVPAEIDVPGIPLSRLLDEAARRWPTRIALEFLGAELTYAQVAEAVSRAAGMLEEAGVRRGDPVALVLPNCPQHVIAFYAVLRLGAVVAEHNPLAPAAELQAQLSGHGARVVIAWEKTLGQVVPGGDLRGRKVFAVDLTAALPWSSRLLLKLPLAAAREKRDALRGPVPAGVLSWDRAVAQASPLPAHYAEADPSDLAALLHTGGTTGTPKAVALSHRNLVANALQGIAWVTGLKEGGETILAVLPFFHAFGLTLCLTFAVRLGATQVILPKFDVDLVLAAMKRHPVTFFPGVPPMFDRLAEAAEARKADLRSIRFSISGAMALDRGIAERWERATGGLIVEGYGMTECSPVVMGNPLSAARRPGTLGLPFPSTEYKVVDPEHPETEVPPGQVGELIVRGPQVFQGYYGQPEETAKVMLPGGWLRTGDLVHVDDGFVVLSDRIKEMIISGGFKVFPSQVEEAVRTMPEVKDVAVVGVPEQGKESVVAVLVLAAGVQRVALDRVRAWAAQHVSPYAVPRQIAFVKELPRSMLGKVLRRVVREQLLHAPAPRVVEQPPAA